MGWLFEPGFFSSSQVHVALVVGGTSAVVSGVVGVFTVLRGQSFAGHALTDASATGGAGGLLAGVSPLAGFALGSVAGAAAMEALGARNARGRDLSTGVVLGASIGLASLFLYLTTSTSAAAGATQQVLFGSIFVTSTSTIPVVASLSVAALVIVALVHRPLLLASVSPDMAAARGIPARAVGVAYMVALALAAGLSSLAVGAILSTALLVGPAATALRVTRRVGATVPAAALIGLAATWGGVLLAYDSGAWGSGHFYLPVSFFVVVLVFAGYVAAGVAAGVAGRLAPARRPGTPRVGSCSPAS